MPDIPAIHSLLNKAGAQEAFSGVVRMQRGAILLQEHAFGLANRPWQLELGDS